MYFYIVFFLALVSVSGIKSDDVVEHDDNCRDTLPKESCEKAVSNGMCKKMWNVMRTRCARTCGFCGPVCRDVFGWFCSRWRYHSVCITHRPRMKEWCRETCGFCRVPSPSQKHCQGSKYGCCWDQQTPASGPNFQGCGACYDRLIFCPAFHDDCFFYRNKDFMAKNCPYTCGRCKP